jgi:hypothetical protein
MNAESIPLLLQLAVGALGTLWALGFLAFSARPGRSCSCSWSARSRSTPA